MVVLDVRAGATTETWSYMSVSIEIWRAGAMVEREHTASRDRADNQGGSATRNDGAAGTRSQAPQRTENDAEVERQLEIGRAVQRDFKEVLAVLAK